MLVQWYCCAHLMLSLCVPAVQLEGAEMGMDELEGFPVSNPSACTLEIIIAMRLVHVQLMVKYNFLPLKELKYFH